MASLTTKFQARAACAATRVLLAGVAVLCLTLASGLPGEVFSGQAMAAASQSKKQAPTKPSTVYEKQPPVTDKELLSFLDVLPHFRSWAKANNEEAHPTLNNGKADFKYSPTAAAWVQQQGWNPVRFFCVMGRMAAALAIVEEGNDMNGVRSKDMPEVTEGELALARRHLGTMLKVSGDVPPISR
ncbi:MAG: serine/threonine protein phosphatase [Desulfovibrio sp.]|nr:serine/threonine protein phosphatase [Desulfovibrio sp.]